MLKKAIRIAFGSLTALAVILLPSTLVYAQVASGPNPAPKRFAFLPDFFLDLERNAEHDISGKWPSVVQDCGTADMNCLRGRVFRVTWPKNCLNIYEGAVWKTPSVTTQVVGRFTQPGHLSSTVYFVAKSAGVADTLYILRREAGLVGVIHDFYLRGTLADADQLPSLLAELETTRTITGNRYSSSFLTGFGKVGVCRPPEDPTSKR